MLYAVQTNKNNKKSYIDFKAGGLTFNHEEILVIQYSENSLSIP